MSVKNIILFVAGFFVSVVSGFSQAADTAYVSHLLKKGDSIMYMDVWKAHDLYMEAKDSISKLTADRKSAPEILLLAARCHLACGQIAFRVNNFILAQKCYQEANDLLAAVCEKKCARAVQIIRGDIILGFARIQLVEENLEVALRTAQRAKEVFAAIKDDAGIAKALIMTGHIYHSGMYQGWHSMQLGIDAMSASLQYSGRSGDERLFIHALINIGGIYHDGGNFSLAEKYYRSSIDTLLRLIEADTGDLRSYADISGAYTSLGNLHRDQKIYDMAEYYQSLGFQNAMKSGNVRSLIFAALCLAQSEYQNKKYKEAFEHLQLHTSKKDELFNEVKNRQLLEMETRYRTSLQEKEIAYQDQLLRRETTIRWLLSGGLLVLLVAVIVLVRSYFVKQRHNRIIAAEMMRSEELLLNILPAEVAEEMKVSGIARARSFDPVTLLVASLADSGTMVKKLSADKFVNEIDHCFREFDRIISKYSIEKIKTVGGVYFCAAGLPVPSETHAADMVQAALEMADFVEKRGRENSGKDKPGFTFTAGIHTGPVVAGVAGEKKFSYDIWGDTVNTAFNLESCSEPGRLNASFSTWFLAKDKFRFAYRGKLAIKTKGYVDMYFALGPLPEIWEDLG